MQLIENAINLNQKSALYYTVKQALEQTAEKKNMADNDNKPKPHAHFYGGNGFAVGVYEPLLVSLADSFNISSLAMRGCWYDKPKVTTTEKVLTREQDADMLIEFLEKTLDQRQGKPIVGIGHSQGATATAIAAAKRPDLFQALYLIEPVTFTKGQTVFYNLIPNVIKMNYEPFNSTLKKQSRWEGVDDHYHYLRSHRAYKRVSDEYLRIYAQNSLIKSTDNEGFELLFAPEQELANYFGTPFINDALRTLNDSNLPYHIIKGKPSIFISKKVREQWKKFVPKHNISLLPEYGHLLPVEAPKLVADNIMNHFMKSYKNAST